MKKTIFLGIAALLALAVFSCNDVAAPGVDGSTDGITLSVKDSARRALTGTLAQAGTDLYEATFVNASNVIIRTTWNYAQKGKIQIEPGTYTVIIMAGRNSDKTLLGAGTVQTVNGTGSSANPATLNAVITANTTAITFNVYPLLNDIQTTSAASTFSTAPTTATVPTTLSTTKDTLGNNVPIFIIDKGAATPASWKFTLGTANQLSTLGPKILVASAARGTPSVFVTGYSTPGSLDVPKLLDALSYTGPVAGAVLTAGEITFTVTAPDTDGMVQIALEVPVVAVGDTAAGDNSVVWYIRGGLSNGLLDAGKGTLPAPSGALGGAVVLGFGNLSSFPTVSLTPNTPWQP